MIFSELEAFNVISVTITVMHFIVLRNGHGKSAEDATPLSKVGSILITQVYERSGECEHTGGHLNNSASCSFLRMLCVINAAPAVACNRSSKEQA